MSLTTMALLSAFAATTAFSAASVVFARYSREISVLWMNTVKALVCGVCLFITLAFLGWSPVETPIIAALAASGALGLGLADLFLLSAFARIGASRTLMLFAFQPVIVGLGSALLLGQQIHAYQIVSISFFMICLFLLSLEKYRQEGHWEIAGLVFAFVGVVLDNTGVLITRWSFDNSAALNPMQANFLRTVGALGFFLILSFIRPIRLKEGWAKVPRPHRGLFLAACAAGTFVSLTFWMIALKYGHLASVASVALASPAISALIECVNQRKAPSYYLLGGLLSLVIGASIALSQGSFF